MDAEEKELTHFIKECTKVSYTKGSYTKTIDTAGCWDCFSSVTGRDDLEDDFVEYTLLSSSYYGRVYCRQVHSVGFPKITVQLVTTHVQCNWITTCR